LSVATGSSAFVTSAAAVACASRAFDAAGKNVSGVPYAAEHLTGVGVIAGRRVRCIEPASLVQFHTGL